MALSHFLMKLKKKKLKDKISDFNASSRPFKKIKKREIKYLLMKVQTFS